MKHIETVHRLNSFIIRGIFYASIVVLWWAVAHVARIDPFFLPKPINVISKLVSGLTSGDYATHLLWSFMRVLIGFSLCAIGGILSALILAGSRRIDVLLHPVHSFLRYIPPTAYLGLIVLWFGIGETAKITLIFVGTFFYQSQMTYDVVMSIKSKYADFCFLYGISSFRKAWHVMFMGSLPAIIDALRVNYAGAWLFLLIAEYLGGEYGLGFMISRSQRYLDTEELFAVIFLLGIIGTLSDQSFKLIKRSLCHWTFIGQDGAY